MGTQLMIFIKDYKLMKEAFSRSEFTLRPNWEVLKFIEEVPHGIVSSSGIIWHNNRRFTLRQLRDLGMGKSSLVGAVQHQGLKLRETIAEKAGTPGMIPHQLNVTVINVIWHMVASAWRVSLGKSLLFCIILPVLSISSILFIKEFDGCFSSLQADSSMQKTKDYMSL
uniref:Cytochrome P450 n=1 Tax=Scylla olivacea TaxID=85551 RepID=A0A0N7ZA00_SCYOL